MIKKYYADLVNRVFNVLYIYENDMSAFEEYVKSLTFELSGNEDFSEIQQIRFKLNALLLNDICHSFFRNFADDSSSRRPLPLLRCISRLHLGSRE